ncbi:hypothetical protein LWC33_29265 [Pseudonocardia sp. RS11V-5]|uniref:hypothetical protein n=1 Tax=Pseudonocardia terrae TaxID=2905831 RepID=UPI001E504E63|nr:hypothetical protein [Pseudonocardia terrae]MCE3555523.1 hypothetical protein [Pseudonocardia terrae]
MRWLLHSRRRFYTVVVGAFVVVVVAARVAAAANVPHSLTTAAAPTPAASSSVPAPSTQAPPPATMAPLAEPSSPRAVAEQFAQLWASPDTPSSQWLKQLQPLATEEYGSVILTQVNPANVPARAVAGPARVVSQSADSATVTVPLDTLGIRIELVDVGGGTWRVSDVQPLSDA